MESLQHICIGLFVLIACVAVGVTTGMYPVSKSLILPISAPPAYRGCPRAHSNSARSSSEESHNDTLFKLLLTSVFQISRNRWDYHMDARLLSNALTEMLSFPSPSDAFANVLRRLQKRLEAGNTSVERNGRATMMKEQTSEQGFHSGSLITSDPSESRRRTSGSRLRYPRMGSGMHTANFETVRVEEVQRLKRWLTLSHVDHLLLRALGRFGLGFGMAMLIYLTVRIWSVQI